MDPPKTTKELRWEKKKRKTIAFLEIAKLNEDEDQVVKKARRNEARLKEVEELSSSSEAEAVTCPSQKHEQNVPDQGMTIVYKNPARNLDEESLKELRKLLKERCKAIKQTPSLRLQSVIGEGAKLTVAPSDRVPLFLTDLQHFSLYSLLVRDSPCSPRWCVWNRAVSISSFNILFIENAGLSDFMVSKDRLPSLSDTLFPFQVEVLMPSAYCGDLVQEFCAVPLSHQQSRRAIYQYGSLEAATKSFDIFKVLRAVFPVEHDAKGTDGDTRTNCRSTSGDSTQDGNQEMEIPLPPSDKFPRTQLLLSTWQMLEEGYPMPINSTLMEKFKEFVPTKHLYKEVTNHSPMYGVDCEMCITSSKESECTRVSIVNEKLETVLDTLVMPYNRITNYLTQFSGITQAMMEGVTTRLEDVQKFIQENIEPDAILVGQSLQFDLIALKMFHPYVIDTSIVFNVTGDRFRKSKLRLLTQTFLKEDIQTGSDGHCSIEDSSASLRLVQLKLSKSIEFGDLILESLKKGSKEKNEECSTKCPKEKSAKKSAFAQSFFYFPCKMSLNSLVVGMPEVIERYVDYLNPKRTAYVQEDDSGNCPDVEKGSSESQDGGIVTCAIVQHSDDVVRVMAKRMLANKFCIGHIQLSTQESVQLETKSPDIISRLDNWVKQIYSAVPMNGVCMVVLCGREKSSKGVCYVSLKTKKVERVQLKLPQV